jgi:NAD(P)-dependent dehydrogenase (short-subunit alcohol dehydrogenase family)
VFLSGRREQKLIESTRRLAETGRASYQPGDATNESDVVAVTTAAAGFMSGLDTVVISAGTSGVTSILTASLEEFQRICHQNLVSVFLASRHAAGHLVSSGGGAIIAISSMYGLVGQRERVAYCAAKSGVIGMVRAMALDLADKGVRANAICPGFIETELAREVASLEPDPEAALRARRMMHPIPRAGLPEEIGELAAFLASDAGAWATGQAIAIDGGYTAR